MKNIQQIHLDKYNDPKYELGEDNIYKNTAEDSYVFAVNFDLEATEDAQYPLEDILDKFYLHVSDFIDEAAFATSKNVSLELSGDLEDIQTAIKTIIGKRVYNAEYISEGGITRVKLVIK